MQTKKKEIEKKFLDKTGRIDKEKVLDFAISNECKDKIKSMKEDNILETIKLLYNPNRMNEILEKKNKNNNEECKFINKQALINNPQYKPKHYLNDMTPDGLTKFYKRHNAMLCRYKKGDNYEIPEWYAYLLKYAIDFQIDYKDKIKKISNLYDCLEEDNYSNAKLFFKEVLEFRKLLIQELKQCYDEDDIDILMISVFNPFVKYEVWRMRKVLNFINIISEFNDYNSTCEMVANASKALDDNVRDLFRNYVESERANDEKLREVSKSVIINEIVETFLKNEDEWKIMIDLLEI